MSNGDIFMAYSVKFNAGHTVIISEPSAFGKKYPDRRRPDIALLNS